MSYSLQYFAVFITLVPQSKTLLGQSAIGESCTYPTDCKPEYSYCYNREECRCKKNYTLHPNSGQCVPECFSIKGCPDGGYECLASACKCDRHYIKLNEMCVEREKVHLGEKCKEAAECLQTKNSDVQCLNDVCSCGNGYRHAAKDVCLPGLLGAPCKASHECNSLNGTAYCEEGICQCKRNFIKSNITKTCLKLAKLNELCEERHQCIQNNSDCYGSKCQCIKGYRIENGKCIRSADLGENCTINEECNPLSGTTHCNKDTCDCRAPEFMRSTKRHNSCLTVSKFSEFCEEMRQCPGNSKCMKGACECDSGFHWNNNLTCEPSLALQKRADLWTVIIMVMIFSIN